MKTLNFFKKHVFSYRVFTLMLIYREQSMQMQYIFRFYYAQMVNTPTRMSTSLVDHVYIKKSLIEESFTVYFSNHYAAKIMIAKNTVRFLHYFIKSKMIEQERRINCFLGVYSNFDSFISVSKIDLKSDK